MRSDICVIGGGPAGLAAALALTRSGREVTVLDCAVPPIDKACGEGLMPDSLEALGKLGMQLPDGGAPLQGIRFFGDKSSVSGDFPNGAGRGMRRMLLHQLFIARAEAMGIRMMWGVKNVHTRRGRVSFRGGHIDTDLIVGADGQRSMVRSDAGLTSVEHEKRRHGFRRHYDIPPWSAFVEIYWGNRFQIYVTPVAPDRVCVALISRDPYLRLDAALRLLPALAVRLKNAAAVTPERGALSITRRLRRVSTDGYVLLGDASGSVDAITGEGMCLAFKQATALVDALDAGDMRLYERRHREIGTQPLRMAALMLLLDTNRALQQKALAALEAHPQIFSSLLAAHVGYKPLKDVVSWRLFSFGLGVLCA
jgi:flavin-dependent dehydrogenase